MRKYSKRTKSTASKTYADYLKARKDLEKRGIRLKKEMTEESFNEYYSLLKKAKKAGEIKSQPWQELMRLEREITTKQARKLAQAASDLEGRKVTIKEVEKAEKDQLKLWGDHLNSTKTSGIYGGKYE